MTIVTISRGSFSKGRQVAEATAERLGYDCVSRDVLLDASDRYNIPEIKLERAIHDAPSIIERLTHGRQSYVAYIRSALAERAKNDNIVYHGLAGHVLLKGIDHVLKVRIIADLEDRVAQEMERDGVDDKEARARIAKDDAERQKWTQNLYGVDPRDPDLYDLVIHIQRFEIADAVDLICHAVESGKFSATSATQRKMVDLALACRIKAELVVQFSDVAVSCEYGNVLIFTNKSDRVMRKLVASAKSLAERITGINNVEVHSGTSFPPEAV